MKLNNFPYVIKQTFHFYFLLDDYIFIFHFSNNTQLSQMKESSLLSKYYQIKKMFQLPLKLNVYFTMLQKTLASNFKEKSFFSSTKIRQPIVQVFLNCLEEEKIRCLYEMMSFIKKKYQEDDNLNQEITQQENQEQKIGQLIIKDADMQKQKSKGQEKLFQSNQNIINQIITSAQLQQTVMKIPYWYQVRFKINKQQKVVDVISKKRNFRIDLRIFFVRKSHRLQNCLVFQALICDVNQSLKILHFKFSKNIYENIYQELFKIIIQCRNQQLLQMMKEEEAECQSSILDSSSSSIQDKTLVFLSKNSISKYKRCKDNILKRVLIGKFKFKTLKSQNLIQNSDVISYKIDASQKYPNILKLQLIYKKSCNQAKQLFIEAYNTKFKFKISQKVLQQDQDYQAFYQKFLLRNKIYEVISIREIAISQKQQVAFIKGIQHVINKDYLQFILVKVRKINEVQSKIIVICSFVVQKQVDQQLASEYLLQFKDMLLREKIDLDQLKESISDDDFHTIKSHCSLQDVQFQEESQNIKISSKKSKQKQEQKKYLIKKSKDQSLLDFISKKPFQKAFLKMNSDNNCKPSQKKFMKEHYLFLDWERLPNGGVICNNEVIIGQQKKIFKKMITKMGESLFKGSGILNVSLPVQIFKKQSHLVSIAKNFCYAPRLLEKNYSSLEKKNIQRVKYATILAISVGTIGISLDKPFNPLLGQTYQGWIDNCPIYLQQISHHPPISAYLFKGRGYQISGQIQPKISLGMNSLKGYSQRRNYIKFDDGTIISLIFGKMVIKGLMFGDRQFNYQDKIFVFDLTNLIFAQIHYGPKKKSFLGTIQDPSDFVYGKIYKVKQSFKENFEKGYPNAYPKKEQIQVQLSQFEGIWCEQIKFDEVQYINLRSQLPYQLEHEQYALESNSWNRKDLIYLIQGNITEAQKQKQILQSIQRQDRKLRQVYKKQ